MSKKVFCWLIVDLIFAGGVTLGCILLGHAIAQHMGNAVAAKGVSVLFTAIYCVVDAITLFYFLLYWWSDRKWTAIKRKFKKLKRH